MTKLRKVFLLSAVIALLGLVGSSFGQTTTGVVRGTVTDQNGAVVPGAKVTISRATTNFSQTATTGSEGTFQFSNLLVAEDYVVTVEAANFKKLSLNSVKVQTNQSTDLSAALQAGQIGEVVTVTAGGAELVDTTTANLSQSFNSRQAVDLAQTSIGSGINNLALLSANVTSSGGVGVGTGGSVGGQRPRDNNFVLDGIDNNDKSVTGPQSYISPEEVAEFTLQSNQTDAEFARSNGGQFITVTKSGGKDYHGSAYAFAQNKNFNALDNAQIISGITRATNPRYDRWRAGANLSGPFPKFMVSTHPDGMRSVSDRVFFFTSYERLQTGAAGGAAGIQSPTAAGRATIATIPGLNANNRSVFLNFMPTAPSQGLCDMDGIASTPDTPCFMQFGTLPAGQGFCTAASPAINCVPIGNVAIAAPNFSKQNHVVANVDYTQSSRTSHRFRFTMTNQAIIDTAASLPQFFIALPLKQRIFSYTNIHNFSSNFVNELRLGFRRSSSATPAAPVPYPGLGQFPNISIDELGVNIGPDPNAPQTGIENNYQVVDNMTWIHGNHTIKFGGDYRDIISPQTFTQRVRGDYEYGTAEVFLKDLVPDVFAERNAGNNVYYGNQNLLYAFVQDNWRVRPNLTFNLGVNYSYQQVPSGARTSQALNSISSVPGLLTFNAPKTQKANFAPKFGLAWSPDFGDGLFGKIIGPKDKTSIRLGFSKGYDYIFDNLYILSNPPQLQQTNDCPGAAACHDNFLASGGLPDTPVAITSATDARNATGAWIPDQLVPYALTWTASYQRQFHSDWGLELRYLGTKGVHLLTQNRINIINKVDPANGRSALPTFIGTPTAAQLATLTTSLATINARSNLDPVFAAAGFISPVVAFLSNGSSIYHGGSASLTKRFSHGLQGTVAYTLSHLIDDTTAEVFSTVLSPRRVQNFRNLKSERATSALDHKHRFVTSWLYDVPWMQNAKGLAGAIAGGWKLAGTYTYESGENVTMRSGVDSNLNGDNAGDRAIFNPNGVEGVGSVVCAINAAGQTIDASGVAVAGACTSNPGAAARAATFGYIARNPNARYIEAGPGALSTIGRNTWKSPSINNVDLSVFKNFRTGETSFIQFRADFLNALNHPQYVPGAVNDVTPIGTTGVTQYNAIFPLNGFLQADQIFASHSRVIQLALRYNF